MKKTFMIFGKEYQPTASQEKYFWVLFVLVIVPTFCVFYLTLLGIKTTIAFDSWMLAIIAFFVLFLEVSMNNGYTVVKKKLIPDPLRTIVFITFFFIGVFA
jgi:hypothetical protein